MADLHTNLAETANEYDEIHGSLQVFVTNLDGMIENFRSTFETGQVDEVDKLIEEYSTLKTALDQFGDTVDTFQEYLRGDDAPDTPEDIDKIRDTFNHLIDQSESFRMQCIAVAEEFEELGLDDVADSLAEVADSMADLPDSIEESFVRNQLVLVLFVKYFPETLQDDISEIIDSAESEDSQRRNNSYAIIAMLAEHSPDAVAEHSDKLVNSLQNATAGELQNILAALVLISSSSAAPDDLARNEAIELVRNGSPTNATYAALLLLTQSTSEKHAKVIAQHIGELIDATDDDELVINITSVMCQLAESHPGYIDEMVPDIIGFLDGSNPRVKENVIEMLGHLERVEYRERIEEIHRQTSDPDLKDAAAEALKRIPAEPPAEPSPSANQDGEGDEVIATIEEVLKDMQEQSEL